MYTVRAFFPVFPNARAVDASQVRRFMHSLKVASLQMSLHNDTKIIFRAVSTSNTLSLPILPPRKMFTCHYIPSPMLPI